MTPAIWDRDRDGPGVLRVSPLAEAIERAPMEDFLLWIVALSKLERRTTMTQAELDLLPDVTEQRVAIYQGPDDGTVFDLHGVCWMIGWLDGCRVKRRFDR